MVKILTPLCGVGFTKTKISKIFNKNRKISFRITFFWLILSFLFLLFSFKHCLASNPSTCTIS